MKHICILLILLFSAPLLFAEYYRYTDEKGILHFTDNLADVPVDKRTDINRFAEIKTVSPDEPAEADKFPLQTKGVPEETQTLSTLQKLNREKQILDDMYETLVTKKQALKQEKAALSNADQISAYQKKVAALNQQISDFEAKRQAFGQKVKELNTQSTSDN